MTESPTYAALVVDDNRYNRDLSALALKHAGYQVTETQTGREALMLLAQRAFDLLVLDLTIPDMDGVALLDKIDSEASYSNMRIIVLTANPNVPLSQIGDRADYVMYTPINVVEFSRLVERLITRPSTASTR